MLIDFVLKDRISGAKFLLSMQRCNYLGIGWVSSGYGVHNSIFDSLMNNNANHIVANCGSPQFFFSHPNL